MVRHFFTKNPGLLGLRHLRLIVVALAIQVIVVGLVQRISFDTAQGTLIASYVLLLVALAPDLRNPAITVIFFGASLNFLVIAANGGAMPLDPFLFQDPSLGGATALSPAEFFPFSKDAIRFAEETRLRFLADRLAFPGGIKVLFSVGDLVLAIGLAMLAATAIGRALFSRNRRPNSSLI